MYVDRGCFGLVLEGFVYDGGWLGWWLSFFFFNRREEIFDGFFFVILLCVGLGFVLWF